VFTNELLTVETGGSPPVSTLRHQALAAATDRMALPYFPANPSPFFKIIAARYVDPD
jgi:hypothetical protein